MKHCSCTHNKPLQQLSQGHARAGFSQRIFTDMINIKKSVVILMIKKLKLYLYKKIKKRIIINKNVI